MVRFWFKVGVRPGVRVGESIMFSVGVKFIVEVGLGFG